jgi:hypothetical protein
MASEVPDFPGFDRDNLWGRQDLLLSWRPTCDPAKTYPSAPTAPLEVLP